jgi:hypothetical protein
MRRRGETSVSGKNMVSPAIGDDTIELELTPEQLLELSQAAELPEPFAPAQISAFSSPQPRLEVRPANRFGRGHLTSIAKTAGAIIAYVALAWWSASQLAARPQPPATAAARPAPAVVIPRAATLASASQPSVRVVNPFDAREVFEFPAGTSRAEGRKQVAQILLQRAHERQAQWEHIKPVANLRTASLNR